MTDSVFIYAGITLVASYVLGELLQNWASGNKGRLVGTAVLVVAASYVLLGVWKLWLVPVIAGLIFVIVRLADARRPETARSWIALQVVVLVAIAAFSGLALPSLIAAGVVAPFSSVWNASFFAALTVTTGLAATVGLGGSFMNVAIRPFALQMRGPSVVKEGGRVIEPLEDGFENAGCVIGHYERLLIFVFVLVDAPIAIGFLVAAKSVFRFGDLTDGTSRKNAEYLIIGTLMSFAYGLVTSYGTRFILSLLTNS